MLVFHSESIAETLCLNSSSHSPGIVSFRSVHCKVLPRRHTRKIVHSLMEPQPLMQMHPALNGNSSGPNSLPLHIVLPPTVSHTAFRSITSNPALKIETLPPITTTDPNSWLCYTCLALSKPHRYRWVRWRIMRNNPARDIPGPTSQSERIGSSWIGDG
jgi:hypothetical protein